MRWTQIYCLLILCCLLIAREADSKSVHSSSSLRGHVSDQTGVPIRNAFIVVYSESGGVQPVLRSNGEGKFEVNLGPGFYDVLVGAVAFSPASKRIEVKTGAVVTIDQTLIPDSEHLQDMQ